MTKPMLLNNMIVCHTYATFISVFFRTPPVQQPYVLLFCCFPGNMARQSVVSVHTELCFSSVLPEPAVFPAIRALSLQL